MMMQCCHGSMSIFKHTNWNHMSFHMFSNVLCIYFQNDLPSYFLSISDSYISWYLLLDSTWTQVTWWNTTLLPAWKNAWCKATCKRWWKPSRIASANTTCHLAFLSSAPAIDIEKKTKMVGTWCIIDINIHWLFVIGNLYSFHPSFTNIDDVVV